MMMMIMVVAVVVAVIYVSCVAVLTALLIRSSLPQSAVRYCDDADDAGNGDGEEDSV